MDPYICLLYLYTEKQDMFEFAKVWRYISPSSLPMTLSEIVAILFTFPFFSKLLKFVWGVSKWKISTRKKHISHWEKIGESDFALSEKYFSYVTAICANSIKGPT